MNTTQPRGKRIARRSLHNRVLRGLCLGLSTALVLSGCGRAKIEGEIGNQGQPPRSDAPKAKGPAGPLPVGYTPQRTTIHRVRIGNLVFDVPFCTTNTDIQGCVYTKTGDCESTSGGWFKVCSNGDPSSQSLQAVNPLQLDDDTGITSAPGTRASTTPRVGTPLAQVGRCRFTNLQGDYDIPTDSGIIEFTLGCQMPVPDDLVNVLITTPDGVSLPVDLFSVAYAGVIPAGSSVLLEGDPNTILWNCLQFGLREMQGTDDAGHRIDVGIATASGGIPFWIAAVDAQVVRSSILYQP